MLDSALKQHLWQWILCAFLLVAPVVLGQQPGLPLPKPPISNDNTPDTKTSHHHRSTKDVEEKLSKGFDSKNAAYAGSNIHAAVDDQTITLSGTVNSESQREMARQLAQAYGDDRKIVDHLIIR